jgi:hypothetical protein
MRAREFIREELVTKIEQSAKDATPGAKKYPQMNQYYELYRFGVAMASSPDNIRDQIRGPSGDAPVTIAYSSGDEEIINSTLKQTGHKGISITPPGSREMKDTNTVSPVSNWMKNK